MTFGGSDRPANCPTDGSMQELFGFDVRGIKPVFTGENIPWDHCKWTLQTVGVGIFELPLLKDWQFTVTRADDVVSAYYGDGNTLKVKGATIRYLAAYNSSETSWVNDGCQLLDREDSFGHRRKPVYHTVSGNIACSGFAHPIGVAASTAVVNVNGPTDPTYSWNARCFDKAWLSTKVGGPVEFWTIPDWDGGAAVYKGPHVVLYYPGFGSLDVWIGSKLVSITAMNANQLQERTFDGASFHCR